MSAATLAVVRLCNNGLDFVDGRPLLFHPIGVTMVLPTIFFTGAVVVLVVALVVTAVVTDTDSGENIGGTSFIILLEMLPN